MATRPIASVLNPKGKMVTSLDVDRENFEKHQIASITKAICSNECPVKQKHVRMILIGTHQEKSASFFWNIVRRTALQESPIVCWKFCHVLHKLLRDGHRKTIADSYHFRGMIIDLGKMWGMLREGYGKLIQAYCTLLVSKIDFHARNQRFPGNLQVSDGELDKIGESDVNVFFQLACEMFDYLDEVLNLEKAIFGSLDMSRANSMTNAGQCRLAPLIPCIQDSSCLYDYCVKVLFKLHAVLPPGTLDGHRSRFNAQFKALKQFYINSSHLQYFKNLIQVPLLPDNPPNFLRQSDLRDYVSPIVRVQNDESPDGSEAGADSALIDVSIPRNSSDAGADNTDSISLRSFQQEQRNGTSSIVEEKNRMINKLMAGINELHNENQQKQAEFERGMERTRKHIMDLEAVRVEQERLANSMKVDKEAALREIEELRQELDRQNKSGADSETELIKVHVKNYQILKEAYAKMRAEHLELIRSKADLEKQMASLKSQAGDAVREKEDLECKLKELKLSELASQGNLAKTQELIAKLEGTEALNRKLLTEMAALQTEKTAIQSSADISGKEVKDMRTKLSDSEINAKNSLMQVRWHFLQLVAFETQIVGKKLLSDENNMINMSPISVGVLSCPAEYFFLQCDLLYEIVNNMFPAVRSLSSESPNFDHTIQHLIQYFQQLSSVFSCGKSIEQSLPIIELGQELLRHIRSLGVSSVNFNQNIRDRADTVASAASIKQSLDDIISLKKKILPELSADVSKDIGDQLKQELSEMETAIKEAARRIEELSVNSKKTDTGVKLEVNEKILDSCTDLIASIIRLIQDSKALQEEIVSQGKGSAGSVREFYQRNGRWTEGLISAAKVVALAAKLLVDAADKVISGKAKLSELMAASNEIAAATAQLVVASRVKADRTSEKLSNLSHSSKRVSESTGNIVATAKVCSQKLENNISKLDFSAMSLTQAKKLEFECQAKVIELQFQLDKERERLASLRKQHYHLAGASES